MMSSLQKELWGYPISEIFFVQVLVALDLQELQTLTGEYIVADRWGRKFKFWCSPTWLRDCIRTYSRSNKIRGIFWCMNLLQMDTTEFAEIFFGVAFQQDLALLEEEQRQKNQADQMPWRSLWAEDLEQAPSAPEWVPMMPQQARFLGCWNLLAHEDLRKTGR